MNPTPPDDRPVDDASTPAPPAIDIGPSTSTSTSASAPAVGPQGGIRSGKLAGRTMSSAIWVLAWPVLIQQLLQAFVGMTDKVLAGRLGSGEEVAALDAIGIGSYIGWFIGIAMSGLGIGGQALIARAMGAGDERLAHRALGQAMTMSMIWGGFVAVVLWFSAAPLGRATGLDAAALEGLIVYLRVLAISMPFAGIMLVGAQCLYGAGETTWPAAIAIIMNIINVVASWLLSGVDITIRLAGREFTLADPLGLDYGIAGIAGGTSIGYLVGAVCTLFVLVRGVKDLALRRAALTLERPLLVRIVRIGVPNFAEGISMWAVNLFVLVFIGIVAAREAGGSGLQGAHIIAVQWEAFSFLPGFAIGSAAGTLAGQYLGAGRPDLARRAILVCTGIAVAVMGTIGLVFITQGELLTSIISDNPIHLETVPKLLVIGGSMQVFFAITMVIRQGLRGVGDTKWCLLITSLSSYAVRLPATYILGVMLGYGLVGIWIGLCGEFVVRATLFSLRFRHGGWARIRI
jgi:putative MATE family efflux protein